MEKKKILFISFLLMLIIIITLLIINRKNKDDQKYVLEKTQEITTTVISISDDKLTVQDSDNIIYTFDIKDINADIGSNILIKYTGILNKNTELQTNKLISYTPVSKTIDENGIPSNWQDNGIFSKYYLQAYNKLKTLSLEEKIGQLFLVRYSENSKADLKKYQFSGYIFFAKDFENKTKAQVKTMITELQDKAKIPLLTAVDEEGGKVVRVSSNPALISTPFKSSQELYNLGGFEKIKEDTIEKSKLLSSLELNLNLAPVVDVSTNPSDYIYERSFGKDTDLTKEYAKTVIEASKNTDVSYTLKHFPGYGNNTDTHDNISIDNRSLDEIKTNDLPPFISGINAGAEAVLISHNTVVSIDNSNPASLSPSVHNLLRNDLSFTGIIISDNLDMGALTNISNKTIKAVQAGNDLIITTDYEESIESVKTAINNGTINEDLIDKLAFRVLAWKYYKGLIFEK